MGLGLEEPGTKIVLGCWAALGSSSGSSRNLVSFIWASTPVPSPLAKEDRTIPNVGAQLPWFTPSAKVPLRHDGGNGKELKSRSDNMCSIEMFDTAARGPAFHTSCSPEFQYTTRHQGVSTSKGFCLAP